MNLFIHEDGYIALFNVDSVEEANEEAECEEDNRIIEMIEMDNLPRQIAWLCAHFDSGLGELEDFFQKIYKCGFERGKKS